MIEVTDRNGRAHLLNPTLIVRVSDVVASSWCRDYQSHIETILGTVIDCRQSVREVRERMQAAEASRISADAA